MVSAADSRRAVAGGGRRWFFGPAVFDERSFELRVDGAVVALERKVLEVLRQLLQRADEVVTKDDLLATVWTGRIVSESVPAKCVSRIREAIGDDAQDVIKTVHGVGYRLVAPVRSEIVAPPAGKPGPGDLRILLVEDHELFRAGIKLLLADLAERVAFADAPDVDTALARSRQESFDVVLMDYHLPGLHGRDALRALREALPDATFVVLSSEEDPALIRQIVEDGAAGFIPKASSHAVMLAALRLVLAGGIYLPPNALLGREGRAPEATVHAVDALSHRQVTVLRLALQGKASEAIARELAVAEAAVLEDLAVCFRALGVGSRTEAVFAAARAGLAL